MRRSDGESESSDRDPQPATVVRVPGASSPAFGLASGSDGQYYLPVGPKYLGEADRPDMGVVGQRNSSC